LDWAKYYIEQLKMGKTVSFRPRGNSMRGKIGSGQLCTLEQANPSEIKSGDIVLCRVNGHSYLHLVKAIRGSGVDQQFLIGNNKGGINGWTGADHVFGYLVRVE